MESPESAAIVTVPHGPRHHDSSFGGLYACSIWGNFALPPPQLDARRSMAKSRTHALPAIVAKHQKAILEDWLSKQRESGPLRSGQVDEAELRDQSSRFLDAFRLAVQRGSLDDVGG